MNILEQKLDDFVIDLRQLCDNTIESIEQLDNARQQKVLRKYLNRLERVWEASNEFLHYDLDEDIREGKL